MENLFIDTNVYLTFYHFSSDDLEELKKLSVAVENKRIRLYVTEQVVNEYWRNRESKIADALKIFSAQSLPDQFPQICQAYEEYNRLRALLQEFKDTQKTLLEKLRDDVTTRKCGADQIIDSLFKAAEILELDNTIMGKAQNRVALGNPPGKSDSLGDAVNWELLLANVPDKENLHLISNDGDYASSLEKGNLAEFLDQEWSRKKKAKLLFYLRLSAFFREKFPDIELASDWDKELAMSDFINSSNFAETHRAIERLSIVPVFSDEEVRALVEASIINDQINRIIEDSDVNSFLTELVKSRGYALTAQVITGICMMLGISIKDVIRAEDLPF